MKKLLLCLLFLLIVPAFAVDPSIYLGEFNNTNETCTMVDTFTYRQEGFIFSRDIQPVIYYCSGNSTSAVVVYDPSNNLFPEESRLGEIVDANYIRWGLQTGNLSFHYFGDTEGFCSIIDAQGKLSQETLNVAAATTEKVASYYKTAEASAVIGGIDLAKSVGVVSAVDPKAIAIGVSCYYLGGKVKDITQKLANCNSLLGNFANGVVWSGDVGRLEYCVNDVRQEMKDYLDSQVRQVVNVVDTLFNFFIGWPIKLLTTSLNGGNIGQVGIGKTEYDTISGIYGSSQFDAAYFHNPYNDQIIQSQAARLLEKVNAYSAVNSEVKTEFEELNRVNPNGITIFFSDLFLEPNYNLNAAKEGYYRISSTLPQCGALYDESRFNSALDCLETIQAQIQPTEEAFKEELSVKRVFDKRWLAVPIALLSGSLLFVLLKIKKHEHRHKAHKHKEKATEKSHNE